MTTIFVGLDFNVGGSQFSPALQGTTSTIYSVDNAADVYTFVASGNDVVLDNGNADAFLVFGGATLFTGDGDDSLTTDVISFAFNPPPSGLNLGNGNNTLTVGRLSSFRGIAPITITGGDSVDTVVIGDIGTIISVNVASTFHLGGGDDSLTLITNRSISITSDTLILDGGSNGSSQGDTLTLPGRPSQYSGYIFSSQFNNFVAAPDMTLTGLGATLQISGFEHINFALPNNTPATISGTSTGAVTEDASSPNLTTTGNLTVNDPDPGQNGFNTTVTPATGNLGTLSITDAGLWSYSVANSAVQFLGAGQTRTDTFTVQSIDGTASQAINITITGVNDPATFGGATTGSVTEDASSSNLTTTGTLTVSDADVGQSSFQAGVTNAPRNLGALNFDSNTGAWSYGVANSAVQFLGAGQTRTDTFTVTSIDGTPQDINITITGVNDTATIGGTSTGSVTEDATTPNLTATGALTVADVDTGENKFNTSVNSASGNLGSLTITDTGTWNYTIANSAVQFLGAGVTKNETFTVQSFDGTASQNIVVTITGVNDAATITGAATGAVTEDTNVVSGNLTATGSLTVADPDSGQNQFNTTVITPIGVTNLGSLSITSGGTWSYSVANSAVQSLGAEQTKIETFTVKSSDDTASQDITVTINGVNDVPTVKTLIADQIVTTTAPFTLNIKDNFTDVDATDVLGYSAAGLPAGITFNGTTGAFSGTATAPGIFDITVTASDQSTSVSDTFSLIVANNRATAGNDVIFLSALGVSSINALNGNDIVFGTDAANDIRGNGGNDRLVGNGGNDRLFGGDGDDLLDGGAGSDRYIGDAGRDRFVIATGDGFDTIQDWQSGIDKIGLVQGSGLSFTNLTINVAQGKTRIFSGTDLMAELQGSFTLTAPDFVVV